MAPKKVYPMKYNIHDYGIESEVWSFGLTMLEIFIGEYPYSGFSGRTEAMQRIGDSEAPRLPSNPGRFTLEYHEFVEKCLQKDFRRRPNKFSQLLNDPFILNHPQRDIQSFVYQVLN